MNSTTDVSDPAEKPSPTSKPSKRKKSKKSGQPGKPKKKSARQLQEAHHRAAELSAIGWIDEPHKRRIADASFQRRYIKPELLGKESVLQQTKWVEYRYMTPLECTVRFAHEYIAAYRRVYARQFDATVAAKKQPIYRDFGKNTIGEMNSLWAARQFADEAGIPYDVFLDTLMTGKVVGDKWRQLPMPNQLLSGKQTRARLRGRPTGGEMAERLFQPDWDRRFFTAREVDDPVQAAAMRALRYDVLRSSDRPRRLAKHLGTRGLLSEVRARTLFDAELVDDALASMATKPRVLPIEAAQDYVPACFGNRNVGKGSPCEACPVTEGCMRMKGAITRALIKSVGSDDPRLAHKRQVERERQQRYRADKRKREAEAKALLAA